MAYIPPHKRHSSSPTPTPTPRFKQQQNPHSKRSYRREKENSSFKIVYAKDAISKWFPVGLAADDDDDASQLSSMTHLEPLSLETFERKAGQKPLVLVLNDHALEEGSEGTRKFLADPWDFVAENVKHDLFSSFEQLKNEMAENENEEVKAALVARIGKILFLRGPSSSEDPIESDSLAESTLRKLRKTFYTGVPASYVDYVINEVVPKFGLCFESEKDLYQVKLSDNKLPELTISCKCTVGKDKKKLELCKVELNPVRHLVADMSCLDKNLDLRIMLWTKRTLTALIDNDFEIDIELIKRLISYATLDPEVKGGLRWPLGKDFLGDRYTVVGVWHTTAKSFGSSSIRLKARRADRFDFRSSTGEDTGEVTLKMHGIVSQLMEEAVQSEVISTMLEDNLRLIWEYCLNGSGH